jgi:hypothetical protein
MTLCTVLACLFNRLTESLHILLDEYACTMRTEGGNTHYIFQALPPGELMLQAYLVHINFSISI